MKLCSRTQSITIPEDAVDIEKSLVILLFVKTVQHKYRDCGGRERERSRASTSAVFSGIPFPLSMHASPGFLSITNCRYMSLKVHGSRSSFGVVSLPLANASEHSETIWTDPNECTTNGRITAGHTVVMAGGKGDLQQRTATTGERWQRSLWSDR